MVYLQQDAFDNVDASMSRDRQVESFRFLKTVIDNTYEFADRDVARHFFTELTSLYKNWNYAAPETNDYSRYRDEMSALIEQHKGRGERRAAERTIE
jgi:V/A-type H+-transporting ATPase subunit A